MSPNYPGWETLFLHTKMLFWTMRLRTGNAIWGRYRVRIGRVGRVGLCAVWPGWCFSGASITTQLLQESNKHMNQVIQQVQQKFISLTTATPVLSIAKQKSRMELNQIVLDISFCWKSFRSLSLMLHILHMIRPWLRLSNGMHLANVSTVCAVDWSLP